MKSSATNSPGWIKSWLALIAVALFFFLAIACLRAQESSPISITPEVRTADGQRQLVLNFHVPAHNHLYADRLSFEIADQTATATLPAPEMQPDKFSHKTVGVYAKDFVASLPLPAANGEIKLSIDLQGCSDSECYFPETRTWAIHADQTVASLDTPITPAAASSTTAALTAGFKITQRASGYLGKKAFLSFLDQGAGSASAEPTSSLANMGALATIALILLGGLALNLTPCVLPMIPINLAILGAGVKNGNRRRGIALGGAYGFGMALAYGGLGLIVVLTGSKFGTLNSSPWFNFAIALIFVVLGLAMFDKIAIDLSRFQRGGGPQKKSGNAAFVGAAFMGSVSALLAGACVAPVVISVLLLATTSYQQGKLLGLLFPFVLGVGMALPWPFAAGGLSFLPKPGKWMMHIKHGFGVFIFAFALWYGWQGWNLSRIQPVAAAARQGNDSVQDLRNALAIARQIGKPVFIDFRAGWCKNCEAMEHTTFHDQEVRDRLNNFQVVRFEAEHLNDATIKRVLDEFGVLGLPAYVTLQPDQKTTAQK